MTGHAGPRPGRPAPERGSAAVLVTAPVLLLAVATLVLAVLGGVVARQRRVESGADLAALAGAAAVQRGEDGCASARAVAGANGAVLVTCSVVADVVEVVAGRDVELPLGRRVALRARARAGPATSEAP